MAKIIDFGIAKAIEQPLTDQTFVTGIGQFVGTPAYMSPEQAAHRPGRRHAHRHLRLGVLLYELLTGALPFDRASSRRPRPRRRRARRRAAEAEHASEPDTGDDQHRIAAARRTDTVTLRRSLERDLDWIALKAIEKDRTRRYDTANTLAADLQRHLNDEPVSARPPSRRYRLGKFVAASPRGRRRRGDPRADRRLRHRDPDSVRAGAARTRPRDVGGCEGADHQRLPAGHAELRESLTGSRTVTVVEALTAANAGSTAAWFATGDCRCCSPNVGMTYEGLGEYARAERILREAVDKSRASGRLQDGVGSPSTRRGVAESGEVR